MAEQWEGGSKIMWYPKEDVESGDVPQGDELNPTGRVQRRADSGVLCVFSAPLSHRFRAAFGAGGVQTLQLSGSPKEAGLWEQPFHKERQILLVRGQNTVSFLHAVSLSF